MVRFRLNVDAGRRTLVFGGVGGLALLLALFIGPALLAASLDPARAEKAIRTYLERQQRQHQLAELRANGLTVPTRGMAERWQGEMRRLEETTFVSTEVKHFLFAPPTSATRIFVVKALLRDGGGGERTHYFTLSAENRFFNVFWVNETSRTLWLFAFS